MIRSFASARLPLSVHELTQRGAPTQVPASQTSWLVHALLQPPEDGGGGGGVAAKMAPVGFLTGWNENA